MYMYVLRGAVNYEFSEIQRVIFDRLSIGNHLTCFPPQEKPGLKN